MRKQHSVSTRPVRRSRLRAVLVALAVVATVGPGLALREGWGSWTAIGPDGGDFRMAVIHASDASRVRVITNDPEKVFQTTNGSSTWVERGELPVSYVQDACAFDFSRLYAITMYQCHYSTDGGATWSYGSFPSGSGYAYVVCAHPTSNLTVFAAGYKYVSGNYELAFFSSTDGGATWSAASFFSFERFLPYDMAIAPTNPNIIYVSGYKQVGGSYYGALLRTSDGGASWSDISSSVDTTLYRYFYSVAIDPLDANNVYVGGSYMHRSTDGGATWALSTNSMYNTTIGIDPTNPANVYAAGNGTVYRSTNYGQSWTSSSGLPVGYAYDLEVARASGSTLYLCTGMGLFKSTNSGATWNEAHNGIRCSIIPALASAPSNPTQLYAEYEEYAVFTSTNSGDSWTNSGHPMGCGTVCDFLVHPTNPNTVLALEGYG